MRATSATAIGDVLPRPNGSSMPSRSRTVGLTDRSTRSRNKNLHRSLLFISPKRTQGASDDRSYSHWPTACRLPDPCRTSHPIQVLLPCRLVLTGHEAECDRKPVPSVDGDDRERE